MRDKNEELLEASDVHDLHGKSDQDESGKGSSKANPTGKRAAKQGPADRGGAGDSMDKVPASVVPGQSESYKVSVAEMFDGEDLSEDFKTKAGIVLEAAVNEKVSAIKEALEEAYNQRLEEELESAVNELVEKVDEYLHYAVSHYMEENALAIDRGIQVEMAESFMKGLHNLYVEHNVKLDEEEVELVNEMAEVIEELETKLNEAAEREIALTSELNEAKAADLFAKAAEGLTLSEAERFSSLMEGFETNDLDDYKTKLDVIKEKYFGSNKKVLSESFDEEPVETVETVRLDPSVAAIAAAISKSVKK